MGQDRRHVREWVSTQVYTPCVPSPTADSCARLLRKTRKDDLSFKRRSSKWITPSLIFDLFAYDRSSTREFSLVSSSKCLTMVEVNMWLSKKEVCANQQHSRLHGRRAGRILSNHRKPLSSWSLTSFTVDRYRLGFARAPSGHPIIHSCQDERDNVPVTDEVEWLHRCALIAPFCLGCISGAEKELMPGSSRSLAARVGDMLEQL